MKSEKARQELEDGSWRVEVGDEGEDVDLPYHAVRVDVAQYAVENGAEDYDITVDGDAIDYLLPEIDERLKIIEIIR